MMSITISDEDVRRAAGDLKRAADRVGMGLSELLLREGAEMEREIKAELNVGGRTLERGPRGGKIVEHSLPGEPPRKQTGRLQASIGYNALVKKETGDYILDIGAIRGVRGGEVEYAQELELGRSNMAPRPFLLPVVRRHLQSWGAILRGIASRIR